MRNEHFIKKVIRRKEERGISKETMSEWLDISTITLSQIESGNTELDINMCLILAEKLDIPIEEIFECKREKDTRNRVRIILTALAGVLLLVNVGLFLFGKPDMNFESNVDSYCYYVVLNVQNDYVELKERFPATQDDSLNIYQIQRENGTDDIWNNIESGDVVMIWYVSELLTGEINSSDKIARMEMIKSLGVN
ncbi:MAG: helix-turn-helix domain-containing protein [Alistipes sp.]|nr:helix-turn-helix domain-containing protein [Alistipes sp.]